MKIFQSNLFIIVSLNMLLVGCAKDATNSPITTNKNAPGIVTNVQVVNLNGKASLTYTLPKDNDLLYVKAVYETSKGVSNQVVASRYTNNMIVDGFGDTLSHVIKLYAVNSSEVASASVEATVHPLTPGYILARRNIQVSPTFGGFTLSCNNPVGDNLAIIPLVDTTGNGGWTQTTGMDNVYSNDTIIQATIRNQPSVQRKYAFVVRDRWLHYSDTLFASLTPWFEQMLDKSKWNTVQLPYDAKILNNGGYCYEYYMWDENFHPGWPKVYFTIESATTPQMATIDLGSSHTFSRLQLNPYLENGNLYYVRGNPKDFEIWGSNNPDLNDPVDVSNKPGASWTLLTTCHVVKPSGSPYQTETANDQQVAKNGWQFDFPVTVTQSYRYIRIRQVSNWQGTYFMCISEFTLWGN
jgi:hypothetical protein